MKCKTLAEIFIACISITTMCCCNSGEDADLKSMFILKNYGEFHPTHYGVTCKKDLDPYRHYGVIRDCSVKHIGDERSKSKVPGFRSYVREYANSEYITNDFLIGLYRRREGLEYETDRGGTIVISGNSQNQVFRWISNNYRIAIGSTNTEMPKAVIDDYLAKYPPTVSFSEEDFDPQKLYKKEAVKTFERIDRAEKKRESWLYLINNPEWPLVLEQCINEIKVNCLYSLPLGSNNYYGCPITFVDNGKERRRKFEELKQKTQTMAISEKTIKAIPKNSNPFRPGCYVDREYYSDSLLHKMGVDYQDIAEDSPDKWPPLIPSPLR